MTEAQDPLTANLHHVLYEECDDKGCALHHPVGAPGMNRRDLALFLAGAQAAAERFIYASDAELGLKKRVPYSARIRVVEASLRREVENWLLGVPPKKRGKVGGVRRSRRSLRTFR
jgi:hypothetical protein